MKKMTRRKAVQLLAATAPALAFGRSLAAQSPGKISNVELLGHHGRLQWSQDGAGLKVSLPAEKPSDYAVTLKIVFA